MRRGLWALWALGIACVPGLVGIALARQEWVDLSQGSVVVVIAVAMVLNLRLRMRARVSARSGFAGLVEPYNEFYLSRPPSEGPPARSGSAPTSLPVADVETILPGDAADEFRLDPRPVSASRVDFDARTP